MKFALCISGYFSNKNGDDLLTTDYIGENVILPILRNKDTVDIFVHSFDKNNENKILTKYPNLTKYLIENQYDFIENLNSNNRSYYDKLCQNDYQNGKDYNMQSSLSFFYSRCECINLALNHSKENDINYDCIIRCRFDIGIRVKQPFNGYKVDNLVFNPNLNFDYYYSSYWNQLNAGYVGFWEFSNQKNMETFKNLYNYVSNDMLTLNSEYLQTLSNWPDSDKHDFTTNIFLTKQVSQENENYEFIHSINSHLIEKFYLIKCGLYKKSAFLDFTPGANKIYYYQPDCGGFT
jgi:hypothetical protein